MVKLGSPILPMLRASQPNFPSRNDLAYVIRTAYSAGLRASNSLAEDHGLFSAFSMQMELEFYSSCICTEEIKEFPGLHEALQAVFLFGLSNRHVAQKGRLPTELWKTALLASVRCQQLLTKAFLFLPPQVRADIFYFPTDLQGGVQDWLQSAVGAFSVTRVVNALVQCGVETCMAAEEHDLSGIDMFAYPPGLPGLALQVSAGSGIAISQYYLFQDLADFQTQARLFNKGLRLAEGMQKYELFEHTPVVVDVCHDDAYVRDLESDSLAALFRSLLWDLRSNKT